ncbi:MAG: MotA/TolQ/ExbB proton channel family protein [Chitinophagales bacterium]|jgi:biopolymer transport protein ExbB|nr:MotA/TolQ/ExbB proton channel family protein [Bacteroidota bacterium]MBK9507239.1 MotA/TolQ/ExbB proton channel family protein [Bacteroidota bacterium]MBK9554876.1 MotA/TolQ/ExbB proton channel family protein [Bacteroidota bacterium]MBL0281521.1 MotA/TolQ/ExbB proton channel family protein [Bacteroidota bacterium]MBP9878621.1 MotA/TolQ/ExbB proton channel family protein [Chitinophagales bacterium]
MLLQTLLQIPGASPVTTPTTPTTPAESLSLIDLTLAGGPVMIPIGILFILVIFLYFERYLTIRKAAKGDPKFMLNIRDYISGGNLDAAKMLCKNTDTPIARMIEKGIMRLGSPLKNIEVAVENVGKLELYKMEKNLAAIAMISGVGPMLGFLGTVTGMIQAFYIMSQSDQISPKVLSGGIYEAMVTTVAGLIVGIIANVAYNSLIALVEKMIYKMEATTVEFVDLLQEPA